MNQLQGRTPVVWAVTALTVITSLAILRTGLLPRSLGISFWTNPGAVGRVRPGHAATRRHQPA